MIVCVCVLFDFSKVIMCHKGHPFTLKRPGHVVVVARRRGIFNFVFDKIKVPDDVDVATGGHGSSNSFELSCSHGLVARL